MINFLKSLYLENRLFLFLGMVVTLFVFGHFYPGLFVFAQGFFFLVLAVWGLDIALLYRKKQGVFARRECPDKLSNGDENELELYLENFYSFPVRLRVIDEIPFQFQKRDVEFKAELAPGQERLLRYTLRPVKRGEYKFGQVNVYARTALGLVSRRYRFGAEFTVPVYPSFLQMRKYEIMAISHRLQELGIKKVRRLGHSMEFEQIREYVEGDDYRTVNWKATARRGDLMVNQYTEERSQPVYCVIDKGRAMKMPFEGLSLLDYAINATLVLSNIAIRKEDKAGLITFSERMGSLLPADRRSRQMYLLQEMLYKQKTRYLESDFEILYANMRRKIRQRSLVLLFTNFETLSGMRRALPFLRRMARDHLLVVIFFENTELRQLIDRPATDTSEVYDKAIAEKFAFEKRQIVKELHLHGIHAILSSPQTLTVNTLNKYLEMKARGML